MHRIIIFILIIVLLAISILGCTDEKLKNTEETNITDTSTDIKTDSIYYNEKYNFLFEIPQNWEDKYKITEENKKIKFVYSGFEVNGKYPQDLFTIIILTNEEYEELINNPPNPGEVLAKTNDKVYYLYLPLDIGITEEEKIAEYQELFLPYEEIQKRFRLNLNDSKIEQKYELANGDFLLYKKYKDKMGGIIVINLEKGDKVVYEGMPSQPVVSPDKKKFAYISDFEWEIIGEVHLYDIEKEKKLVIKKDNYIDKQYTPKKLTWLDNNRILVIIGLAYGTVSVGGDLYIYDIYNNTLSLVIETDKNTEIAHVSVNNDNVVLDFAKFNKDATDYEIEKRTYNKEEFLTLCKNKK